LNDGEERKSPELVRRTLANYFVKSRKHEWTDACFIPSAADRSAVERVVNRFLELQGEELAGGLVFFEPDHFSYDVSCGQGSCPNVNHNAQADSHGIARQIAPEEPEAQDQPTQSCVADRIDPGGVI
jgi:hypothetical protein